VQLAISVPLANEAFAANEAAETQCVRRSSRIGKDMGLDTVELIMAIEEAFDFKIPNHDAEKLSTVGSIYAYVREHAPGAASRTDLWEAVLDLIQEQTAVERARLVPDAHIVRDLGID
jgi:acyl carrier protein